MAGRCSSSVIALWMIPHDIVETAAEKVRNNVANTIYCRKTVVTCDSDTNTPYRMWR